MEDLAASDPRSVGPYRARAVLGEGGMGRVLLATGRDGSLVAVKMVHAHMAGDEEFRRRFRREVAASRKVAGGPVVPVVDADPDADVPWLASEFVYGPPLSEVLGESGALPQDAVLRLAAGLAGALGAIHAAGLVHRDLSPSNVLLAGDGPKVIDFGIVRAAEGASATRSHTTTTLTRAGAVIGAPGFMSPEQAMGQPLTPATDIFSLGTVLLTACTGTNPFDGPGIPQVLYNVVHTQPDLAQVPERLREIIQPCLAKDPGQRPTPARLLELTGPEDEAAQSWPEEVRRLADRQRAEISRRVAADETADAPAQPTSEPNRLAAHVPSHVMSAPDPDPLTQIPSPSRPATPGGRPRPGLDRRVAVWGSVLTIFLFVVIPLITIATEEDGDTADASDQGTGQSEQTQPEDVRESYDWRDSSGGGEDDPYTEEPAEVPVEDPEPEVDPACFDAAGVLERLSNVTSSLDEFSSSLDEEDAWTAGAEALSISEDLYTAAAGATDVSVQSAIENLAHDYEVAGNALQQQDFNLAERAMNWAVGDYDDVWEACGL